MKKIWSCILVMVLLASAVPMAITPVGARTSEGYKELFEGDNELTRDELVDAILSHMLEEEGALQIDELRDAAHVYVYWDGEPRSITDSVGQEVTIYKPIDRVVCTFPQHIEALRILKLSKDTIVGVPSSLDPYFFHEFGDVPSIGLGWKPDDEAILELNPDVVLFPAVPGGPFGTTPDREQELLEDAGLTVLCFTFNQPEIFHDELRTCGYLFEKEEEAREFLDWHDDILNSISEKTGKLKNKTKVYSEYKPYMVSTADDEIIATAGGKDIFEGVSGKVREELVMLEDPSIIIIVVPRAEGYNLDADGTAALEEERSKIMSRSELQNATAVKNGNVYIITTHIWTQFAYSGCRSLIGLSYLSKWFHPELFPDEDDTVRDPKEVHREYLTRFQGLNINLDEQGVFVYPEK